MRFIRIGLRWLAKAIFNLLYRSAKYHIVAKGIIDCKVEFGSLKIYLQMPTAQFTCFGQVQLHCYKRVLSKYQASSCLVLMRHQVEKSVSRRKRSFIRDSLFDL